MKKPTVVLVRLKPDDREQFILDNQEAFLYGATQEFGMRDHHFEEDGEIIARKTIEDSIDSEHAEAYRIIADGEKAGGIVISVDGSRGDLELLFTSPLLHSKGIGFAAWCEVEKLHPEIKVWETVTPYFEKRNIHFYVNRCGFHIVEFFNPHHPDPNDKDQLSDGETDGFDGMFRFEKIMKEQEGSLCGNVPSADGNSKIRIRSITASSPRRLTNISVGRTSVCSHIYRQYEIQFITLSLKHRSGSRGVCRPFGMGKMYFSLPHPNITSASIPVQRP